MLKQTVLAAALLLVPATTSLADDAAEAVLTEHDLTLTGTTYVLEGEQAVLRMRRDVQLAERELSEAEDDFRQAERQIARAQGYIAQLQSEIDDLRSRARQSDSQREYDRHVTALEQKAAEIEEVQQGRQDFEDEQQEQIDNARAAFLTTLFEVAEAANAMSEQYTELAGNEEVATAIATQAAETGRRLALGPSRGFERMQGELARSAEEYSAGVVDLRKEGSVMVIDVRVNGNPIRSMILDTGAGSISLPFAFARDLGIVPDESTRQVQVQMADGKIVDAWLMSLETVQVGQFVVRDVECLVLPEELHAAPALLGNSFLSHFTYNIDPERGKLLLSRIDRDEDEDEDE